MGINFFKRRSICRPSPALSAGFVLEVGGDECPAARTRVFLFLAAEKIGNVKGNRGVEELTYLFLGPPPAL